MERVIALEKLSEPNKVAESPVVVPQEKNWVIKPILQQVIPRRG